MRVLIQRVKQAKVVVESEIAGEIGPGLLLFLGIHRADSGKEIEYLTDKIVSLRIFSDHNGKMNLSVKDLSLDILVISQFTLYGNVSNGRRPDFIDAAPPAQAEQLYNAFVVAIESKLGKKVQQGRFQAYMEVHLVNDGPVTFLVERPIRDWEK